MILELNFQLKKSKKKQGCFYGEISSYFTSQTYQALPSPLVLCFGLTQKLQGIGEPAVNSA
jgi:hypothetical protein